MAFVDKDGVLFEVHPSDDIMSMGTYEYIDFKMTLPHSYYVFMWRRDGSKFTVSESEKLRKYVKWDLDDETDKLFEEYVERFDDELEWPLFEKLLDDNRCLVLALYEMKLPDGYYNWQGFFEWTKELVDELMEDEDWIAQHDKQLKLYEGRLFHELKS